MYMCAMLCFALEKKLSMFLQIQATSVGVIKPGESFTYTDEVHAYICVYRKIHTTCQLCFSLCVSCLHVQVTV